MAALELLQREDAYCYNSDSLFLYAFGRGFAKNGMKILDVGCGCGVLGLLFARDFKVELVMSEKNPLMADLARQNAARNRLECEIVAGDFLEKFAGCGARDLGSFDLIISNPPFYRGENIASKNPHIAMAKSSANLELEGFFRLAKRLLKPRGNLIFCYDAKEICRVFAGLNESGLRLETLRFAHPSEGKNANLIMCQCRISRGQLRILPPLFSHHEGDFSAEAREIYGLCATKSIKIAGESGESSGESRRESCEKSREKSAAPHGESFGESCSESRPESENLITKNGFDFAFDKSACESCAENCCKGDGSIFVNADEAAKIAAFLGLDLGDFYEKYIKKSQHPYKKNMSFAFANSEDSCVFLDEKNRCKIYPVRPKTCATFPFWGGYKKNPQGAFLRCAGVVKKPS